MGIRESSSAYDRGENPIRLFFLGLGLNVLLAPLASDLSFAVEDLDEENPGLFQSAGAYAQVYSMFNSGMAAGMMAGPPVASLIYSKTNWAIMNFFLAGICVLGTVPVVCCPNRFSFSLDVPPRSKLKTIPTQILFTGQSRR